MSAIPRQILNFGGRASSGSQRRNTVHWAERAFQGKNGRVLGYRLDGDAVQVAFVAKGTDQFVWMDVQRVMTQAEASNWLRNTSFKSR